MNKRMWQRTMRYALAFAATAAILAPQAATAQITRVGSSADANQAIGFNLGYFALRGESSRPTGDVLFSDLHAGSDSLAFDVKDFNGASFGAEYLIGLGDYLEAGVGISYYQHTVPSVYATQINLDTGGEIEQDLKLRVIPMTATVRFLPIGRQGFAPYVGAGIGAFNWKYSERGEFVDQAGKIFPGEFGDKGTAIGAVILGGVRVPVGERVTVGGEVRYQKAEGDASKGFDEGLLGDKVDLGGWTTSFTMHFRF